MTFVLQKQVHGYLYATLSFSSACSHPASSLLLLNTILKAQKYFFPQLLSTIILQFKSS